MKKLGILLLSIAFAIGTGFISPVLAHDLWVWGENGEKLSVDMIYGHDFPNLEKIQKERVKLFAPVKVISKDGETALKQVGEHEYHFEGDKLGKGAYMLHAFYKPTAWIKTSDGKWEMGKTRKDTKKEVTYCGISTMQGKALLSVDGGDDKIITKTFGKKLEITPLFNSITDLKVGELLQFKLTLDGKPVKFAEVYGSYGDYARIGEGYDHSKVDMAFAAFAKSDLEGKFYFRPLKKGLWYLKSQVKTDTGNKDCELYNDKATLVFEVK